MPIAGLEGKYEVSDFGRVKSLPRVLPMRLAPQCGSAPHKRLYRGKTLKPFISKRTGYLQVQLPTGRESVHRLVALAFCAGYKNGLWVNHINGSRTDNRASNLEWVTPSQNEKHSYAALGKAPTCSGKFGGDHPTSKAVVAVDMHTGERFYYASGMDAVREGYRSDSISRCCMGKIAHHKGRYWSYAGG